MKPTSINVLGITYSIEYVNNPAEVDTYKRQSLWGQIDFWTRTIRIYDNGRSLEDIWHTVMHEVVHAIAGQMQLKINEKATDLLALALVDVLTRNGWWQVNSAS